MSAALLDTSAYSAFMRGHPGVRDVLQRSEAIRLTPVILGELLCGFRAGKEEKRNRELLEVFLSSARVDIVEIDEDTSERYAVILNALREKGTPIPTDDIWIASSAMQYGLRVLTADARFLQVPRILVDCLDQDGSRRHDSQSCRPATLGTSRPAE